MLLSETPTGKDLVIRTWSGKQLQLLAPDAAHIEIEDIAHGLAYQCCFNGQTRHFYSIAQHSMLVAQLVPAQHRLAALLHEGATAYLGDIPQALRHLMLEVQLIEKKIMAVFRDKFGLTDLEAPIIRRAHSIALATESRDLLFPVNEKEQAMTNSAPIPRRIEAITPEEAKSRFAEMLGKLVKESAAQMPPASTSHQKTLVKARQTGLATEPGKSCQVFTPPTRINERRLS